MKNALILFILALFLANCHNDEISNDKEIKSVKNYDDYLVDISKVMSLTNEISFNIISSGKQLKKGRKLVSEPIFKTVFTTIEETTPQTQEYININGFDKFNQFKVKDIPNITIDDIKLPKKAVLYLKKLYVLQKNDDFDGIFSLLEEFKKEKNNQDLLSLTSVFSVIELNKINSINRNKGNRVCVSDFKSVIKSAVKGAVIGALGGSWLGPAGTIAGTIGGAVQGGVYGSVGEIGYQAIICATNADEEEIRLEAEEDDEFHDRIMNLNLVP